MFRTFRLIALFLLIAFAVGCASPTPEVTKSPPTAAPTLAPVATSAPAATKPPEATKPAPTIAPTAAPKVAEPTRGGTAVVAMDSDPETLNLGLTTGYSAGDVASKIFNGLVWLDGGYR
ncbi:MAG: hypothetical protein HZC40_14510 [Chloroflexi bacterium]|nr:hypothetical protein [Chloroflexota bacterium]